MTREELKRHCLLQIEGCEMWARYHGEDPSGKIYEEHKLILELLEQEPSNDCISRAEAIKGLGEQPLVWTDSNSEIQQLLDWREHKEMLEKLPSVGQKVGHWIGQDSGAYYPRECSNCHKEAFVDDFGYIESPYCPHCGCRMEGVEQ